MLAQYQNLTEDLFNAVFVSIWSDQLIEGQQVYKLQLLSIITEISVRFMIYP